MSERDLLTRVVESLKDTAAKTLKNEERKRTSYNNVYGGQSEEVYTVEIYSREWIAGRLLGMAEMVDAMIAEPPTPTNPT